MTDLPTSPTIPNWLEYFQEMAQLVSKRSKDTSTKMGVVIVSKDMAVLSTGYNSFVRGIDDHVEARYQRPEKYFWFEHAERNAIYNAARLAVSTVGATMYTNCQMACTDCTRAIIQSGIANVVFERPDEAEDAEHVARWEDHFKRSLEMFGEAKVNVYYYPKKNK